MPGQDQGLEGTREPWGKCEQERDINKLCYKDHTLGQVRWVTPVIPALWEAKVGGLLKVRSFRPACLTWQNPISTKNTKKLAGCSGCNPSYPGS